MDNTSDSSRGAPVGPAHDPPGRVFCLQVLVRLHKMDNLLINFSSQLAAVVCCNDKKIVSSYRD